MTMSQAHVGSGLSTRRSFRLIGVDDAGASMRSRAARRQGFVVRLGDEARSSARRVGFGVSSMTGARIDRC